MQAAYLVDTPDVEQSGGSKQVPPNQGPLCSMFGCHLFQFPRMTRDVEHPAKGGVGEQDRRGEEAWKPL